MSGNSLHLSASAIGEFFGIAIPILAVLGGAVLFRFYIMYKEPTKHYVQDLTLVLATAAFIPVLAALWIGCGSELPISIEVPSSTTTTKLAAVSDICSIITFVLHFVVLVYEATRGTVSQWKIWAVGTLVPLLSATAIILNILEWFLPRINRHAIAIAHAIIRILITVVVFGIIFLTRLWVLKGVRRGYVLSIFICATGIFTTPFMAFRFLYYLAHKEEGLGAALLGCRISEAGLDIVFICLPYIMRPVFRWAQPGSTPPFPIRTPQTNSGYYGSGREFERRKVYHESTEGIFGHEWSEEEQDMEVLGSQSSESLR